MSPSRARVALSTCALLAAFVASSAALAQTDSMDGRWLLVERDGDPDSIAFVSGTIITFSSLDPGAQPPETLTRAPDSTEPPIRWLTPDRDAVVFTFLDPTGQWLLLNEVGDTDRLLGYRLGAVPPELDGAWVLSVADNARQIQLAIDSATGTLTAGLEGRTQTGTIEGIATGGPHPEVLVTLPSQGTKVFRLIAIGPEIYFMGPTDEQDDGILFRPGAAPPWLGALFPPEPPAYPPTP